MAEKHNFAKEAAASIYAVSEDEAVKLACMARERYDHDRASFYNSGRRAEQANTERERKRADEAEARADTAEAKLVETVTRLDEAETKYKETSKRLQEALEEIARLKATAN